MLKDLEIRKEELGVADIQLSLTTLEDVFLGIAKAVRIRLASLRVHLASLRFSFNFNFIVYIRLSMRSSQALIVVVQYYM